MTLSVDNEIDKMRKMGFANYFRWKDPNKTPEEKYLEMHNMDEPPKCIYCGYPASFISTSKGYRQRCSGTECVKRSKIDGKLNEERALVEQRVKYVDYISKHLDLYKDIEFPFYDSFFNEEIDKRTYMYRSGSFEEPFNEDRICRFCGDHYVYNRYSDTKNTDYCRSKSCSQMKRNYNDREFVPELPRNLQIWNFKHFNHSPDKIRNMLKYGDEIENLIKCKSVIFNNKVFKITKFKDQSYKNSYVSMNANGVILPEMLATCKSCGKEYVKFDVRYKLTKDFEIDENSKYLEQIGADFSCGTRKCYINCIRLYERPEDVCRKQSESIKSKIRSGEFTPCVTNSRTHGGIFSYGDIKFRSSWECYFYLHMKDHGMNLLFEKTRIPYISPEDNKSHNYVVDFTDFENDILYEVKPSSMIDTEVNQAKFESARKYASENGMVFKVIDDEWFKENFDRKHLYLLNEIDYNRIIKHLRNFDNESSIDKESKKRKSNQPHCP